MKRNGIVGRGPLSSGPASAAQEAFAEEVLRRLSAEARSRVVRFAEGGSGTLFINYFNVPPSVLDGADRENNRLMITVEGFGRGDKLRAELRIRFTPSTFGDAKYKLRTKSASAEKIAQYVADYINLCAESEPKVRYSPNPSRDLEPNRYLTRFQLERLLRERGDHSSADIARMTDDQLRRAVGHDRLVAAGDLTRNGVVDGEGDFMIAGMYSDGRICEEFGFDGSEEKAIGVAKNLLQSPYFEGDRVRVMSLDGDMIYDSASEELPEEPEEEGSNIETDEFDAPAHWASAFVNGDTSGLEEEDLAEFEAWCEAHPDLTNVVGVSEDCHLLNRNGRREEPDEHAARELSLFIENDYALVGAPNSQGKAIEKNLLSKIRNGTFDLGKSELAWMYLMETGAKKYAKEFASEREWPKLFNKPTRELVAHEFATTFAQENGAR